MSRPNTLRGTYVEVLMGDGATPEVFTVLCGITTKAITAQLNTGDSFTRDCADPEDIPVRELILASRQWDLRGSGQMNRDNVKNLMDAQGEIKNYRFFIRAKAGEIAPALNGYLGGAAAITTFTLNGDDAGYAGIDLSIASHGVWDWNDVAIT